MYSDAFCKVYNEFGWNYFPEAFGEQLLQWMEENDLKLRYCLDLACGTGVLCRVLKDAGMEPRGMDFSEGMIAIARQENPDIPFDAVLADLFRAKGVIENADALGLNAAQVFRIAATEYIRLYDHVLEALNTLRKHGYRLWLLSNAQRAFTAYELRLLGLGPQFDGIYLSSDYQCRKPDVRFFRALLDEQKLDPAKCLMIGNDRETDIAGAMNAGLSTLYMHTNLTPAHQAEADPALKPSRADIRHYEYEGSDWKELSYLVQVLAQG